MDPNELDSGPTIDTLLANHGARSLPGVDDSGYHPAMLLGPANLAQDAVERLNDVLDKAELGRPVERVEVGRSRSRVILRGADAIDVLAALRREAVFERVRPVTVPAELRLNHLIGMPVSKGHFYGKRAPVVVSASPPRWLPLDQIPGGRRPVVAILDTGVSRHPWLDVSDPDDPGDAFLIRAEDEGWPPEPTHHPLPTGPDDAIADASAGPLPTHVGHGTFIAGLIRQIAPQAKVLSMHVMHSDGLVDEDVLLAALEWLRDRVKADPRSVDVICLSLGYYERQVEAGSIFPAELWQVLRDLRGAGVRVVASAGNDQTTERVYPAAFADDAEPPEPRLLSVGANNPNGSHAFYSNHGPWVKAWEVGTAVVSTFPRLEGGLQPEAEVVEGGRFVARTVDPDDFSAGFAQWSGTSFAAAVAAAKQANERIPHGR